MASVLLLPMTGGTSHPPSEPPTPQREFRGAWIATVDNIDWPSKPGLPRSRQQQELLTILDRAVQLRLNAVIFQVRPAADALYASRYEPWSEFLSDRMGEHPKPNYDPLRFAIAEAHRRGLELHAWFNPFRARHSSTKSPASSDHISRQRPELVRRYGPFLWLDPGMPQAREHTKKVILDVVRRYDVDGIHLDDYFYPYKERTANGDLLEFPDDPSWQRYQRSGGTLARDDWRRQNINRFVRSLYRDIKQEKGWVKFGISPFGIWRPGHPPQIKGLDAFASLYADSLKWLKQGWLDYCSPQLYWAIEPEEQSYPALQAWWAANNVRDRHLWPGNRATHVGSHWHPREIIHQIRLSRRHSGVTGNIYWNVSSLMDSDNGLGQALLREVYTEPALVPPSPWLGRQSPAQPDVGIDRDAAQGLVKVTWKETSSRQAHLWVVQTLRQNGWSTQILPRHQTRQTFPAYTPEALPAQVAVSAVNRFGNLSKPAMVSPRSKAH